MTEGHAVQCPRCQLVQENEVSCESCGIYFEKWRQREAEASKVVTTIYAAPPQNSAARTWALVALALALALLLALRSNNREIVVVPQAPATPPPAAAKSSGQPAAAPQDSSVLSMHDYQEQLRGLRAQQAQIYRDMNASRQATYGRIGGVRDEAQIHADQLAQQEYSAQLDSINSQINFLMSHAPNSSH